jgi:hypothetical protein
LQNLKVGFQASMAKYFGAQLQWFAGGVRSIGLGMQNWATVAKPGDTLSVQ